MLRHVQPIHPAHKLYVVPLSDVQFPHKCLSTSSSHYRTVCVVSSHDVTEDNDCVNCLHDLSPKFGLNYRRNYHIISGLEIRSKSTLCPQFVLKDISHFASIVYSTKITDLKIWA
ncbi:unnamed protein product [Oppiella nova]|uniref:Uncharacterized protein n=1 Tax=Oppiella nova TaxID=334625 RepID=A0A7R9M9D2_9ACAR|nr:unnamed protein product [Oppiella nova]CAG2173238.1 unnamed protein product [Oppiella nova]